MIGSIFCLHAKCQIPTTNGLGPLVHYFHDFSHRFLDINKFVMHIVVLVIYMH